MRPRKVLHVLNGAGGGAALSTIALIEAFWKEGIAACAVCHDAGSPEERERLREATRGEVLFLSLYWWNRKIRAALWKRPLIELRQLVRTGWGFKSAAIVADFAREHQADLIHTNTILVPEGGMAARRLGLPHVWHLRELLGSGNPFRLAQSQSALSEYVRRHASLVIANSHVSARHASGSIPAEMMRIVPNGIDVGAFSPCRTPRPADRPLVVAMVASLTSRTKKHALFIEAAARLKQFSQIEFRVYGHDRTAGGTRPGDRYAEEIHQLVRDRGLAERFRWPGHVGDPARIMSEIDILVHPADNESFGRTAVEAMAAGLPVVGVAGGGVGEVVADGVTGLLAAPDDIAGLTACIERLVGDPELCARLCAAGRERAAADYSIEACSAGVLRVYEEAMQLPILRAIPHLTHGATTSLPAIESRPR